MNLLAVAESPLQGELRASRRQLGAVYTPAHVAEWLAERVIDALGCEPLSIIDPACGDGALLRPFLRLSGARLFAADVDKAAAAAASSLLRNQSVVVQDSLLPTPGFHISGAANVIAGGADVVVMNPPWGAELAHQASEYQAAGYDLARGQFDSFDLFAELALALARSEGVIGLILPDALLMPEHEPLRRVLLRNELVSLARLGEGIFPDVYRGVMVAVIRKKEPTREHRVACFRLDRHWRRRIQMGSASLSDAHRALGHSVPQESFRLNLGAQFNLDAREDEHALIVQMAAAPLPWSRWLVSGRGVELSKTGRVIVCSRCSWAVPLPKAPEMAICRGCGHPLPREATKVEIVQALRGELLPGWHDLIVGQDVRRYSVTPSRRILLEVPGINYKAPGAFRPRKLLVRKTGVGLHAAIDETGAYTTQVVFHFCAREDIEVPPFVLDYLLGVLCSRTLLAFHLRRLGDSEWRSHPYVTQRVLQELPIPDVEPGSWKWRQAHAIASEVVRLRNSDDARVRDEADLRVESLVAGMFELSPADSDWVARVLGEAQPLQAIRTLYVPDWALVRARRVA